MMPSRVFVATESAGPRARLAAVLVAVSAGLIVAVLQSVVVWQGARSEYLLLAGFNAFLASLATWFFQVRWRLLGDPFDRQVRNVFLPIACHFILQLTLEALLSSKDLVDTFVRISWVVSQALAAAILLFAFRGGRERGSGHLVLRAVGALAAAVAVWAGFNYFRDSGLVREIGPLEAGLATAFLIAAVVPMLGGREQRQPREVWLSGAFLLSAIAHMDLSWSRQPYDSPFMWGFVLIGLSLATPTIGAVFENVTLLEGQSSLSDHFKRIRQRMEILLNTLPVLVMSVDRDRHVRYANRAANSLFSGPRPLGEPDHELSWLDRIHAANRPQVYSAIPSVLEGGRGSWQELIRVEDSDGIIHWLSTQMHPVVDPVLNETLIQIVAIDVTDLHLARTAAEARQSRLAFLSTLAQTVAGEVEEQKILDHFLETGRALLPLSSLLLYRPVSDGSGLQLVAGTGPGVEAFEKDRFSPISAGGHPCWTSYAEGFPQTVSASAALPQELADWLATEHGIRHLSYLPLMAAGRSAGVLLATSSTALDLTIDDVDLLTQVGYLLGGPISLSQIVRELDEQRAVAFEASRLKSEFLANTSHELRTPLTAILGFLKLIMDGSVEDPEKQREFLKIAHESAESLLNIINDVLDLAKIEAGRLEVHFAPVPVRAIVEDVETLFKHQMKSKGLKFNTAGRNSKLVIWADPDRTVQVLTNLLSNSMKFTERGGSITVDCREKDGIVVFTVEDTGIGMAEDEIAKVFSSFYQVDGSTTRQRGGTGLGLTISRRLAELMGGTLRLESAGRSQGTTAHLSLREFSAEHDGTNPEIRLPT
ncbi:MAG: PAS domain-containing protein [Acidobacteria bacterium]|nr:PAS domain-containing protein [Acidobacteriota bacterium]